MSTAVVLAAVLFIALFVPYAIFYIRRGKASGHTWKPQGHPDIGPDAGFRQTRPGKDDARGARY